MKPTRARRWACILSASLLLAIAGDRARAEIVLGAYGGLATSFDGDVTLEQPGGTDLTLDDVSWSDRSFESPIYYGLRLTYWGTSGWGGALDYTHAKLYADLDDTVDVSGSRAGTPVAGSERVGDTFDALSFSHGHNMLTLNLMYRWGAIGAKGGFLDRLRPYAGVGAGVAIPHVEVIVDGSQTDEYQLAGPAVQGLAGIDFSITERVSLFTEYKLSYAHIEADLAGGGTITVDPITNHFVLGVSFKFQ